MVNEYLEELLAGNPRHATMIKSPHRHQEGRHDDGAPHRSSSSTAARTQPSSRAASSSGRSRRPGPYRIPNTRIEAAHVYTNTIPGGYMRGPGESQAVFALESHIDELAHAVGMDPVEFRMKNLVGEGEETAFGVALRGRPGAARRCRPRSMQRDYAHPKAKNVGRGVALGERPPGGGIGNASITFKPDGTVVARHADLRPGLRHLHDHDADGLQRS